MLSLTNANGSLYVGNMPTTQIYDINLSDYDLVIQDGKGAINITLQKNTINYITNNLDINYYRPLLAGLNGTVNALTMDDSGHLYAGGSFTMAGGAPAKNVAKWNGTTWSALGAGLNNTVSALIMDASRNLYAGGTFTMADVPDRIGVAKWNGTDWSALGAGLNNAVNALTITGGNLYAGGLFTSTNGGSIALNRIAKWDGSAWSALGAGVGPAQTGTVTALTMDASGNLIAGGWFTSAGGAPAKYIAKWTVLTSSWSALGAGLSNAVTALTIDASGNLYAGGNFTTTGLGVGTLMRIAKWTVLTSSWSALGAGLNNIVTALTTDESGNLYAGGSFTSTIDGSIALNRVAKWNGTDWSALGAGVSGGISSIAALTTDESGNLYAGGNFTMVDVVGANRVCNIIFKPLNIFNVDVSVNGRFLNTLSKSQIISGNVTNSNICYSSGFV